MTGPRVDEEFSRLAPVSDRRRWVGGGLLVQVVGVGIPATYLGVKAHRMSVTGHLTAATVRLAWRADAHTTVGLALLIGGALIFAVGSTVMARPFVRRRSTLLVAVPIAAFLGVFVLGVLALILAALVAGWLDWLDFFDFPSGEGRRRRRRTSSR